MRLFVIILSLLATSMLHGQRTILHCGQLIDVKISTIQKEMSIIIDGNKIVDVQKGYATGSGSDNATSTYA